MTSESAQMNSAAEARFRIELPTPKPRAVAVVALDAASEEVVARLAQRPWNQAKFLATSTSNLPDEIEDADQVVMIAAPGGNAQAAAIVGAACSARRVMTTALIAGGQSAPEEAVSKTLAQVRPWALMVVLADAEEYMEDVLLALRA
jgi:hypothetical protein